ncbi:MAG: precorrin-8X methylmutase [Actinomycetia bacterium]|nr:precorrin-8X methylmutase [Actinomycetes bacterium]
MEIKRNPIEEKSMKIIDELVGFPEINIEEKEIRSRLVHTSGDPSLYWELIISKGAVDAGIYALENKNNIVTDVRMVEAGIRKKWLKNSGNNIFCAIDLPEVAEEAKRKDKTRSATAIEILKDKINDSIVLIGNAPTALIELLDLVKKDEIKPALIIGIPVGFVDAASSKEKLSRQKKIPFITLPGTRGGSSIASAILNALINIYKIRKGI